jgi:hypothetical protein
VIFFNCSANNNIQVQNCTFTNCNATNQGGAIQVTSIPLIINQSVFSNNIANNNKGNDIYASTSFTYDASYISGSCSSSNQPRILVVSTDVSSLLENCITFSNIYLASSTHSVPGSDTNNNECSITNPCLTIQHALEVNSQVELKILECDFVPTPVSFTSHVVISTVVVENSQATLGFSSSSSNNTPLFSVTTTNITVKTITIIHNNSSKGSIFSVSGDGVVEIQNLTVRGSTDFSAPSVAPSSFVILTNGGTFKSKNVNYFNLTFSTGCVVSSSSSCNAEITGNSNQIQNIFSNGSGVVFSATSTNVNAKFTISGYNIDNVSVPLAPKGGLVYINGSTNSLSITSCVVTSLAVNMSSIEGGVLNVGAANTITISSCNFTDTKGKIGGAFYISNCSSVNVGSCRFLNAESSNGGGGAIYFGENTGFSIISSFFSNCVSVNGSGGAVATISSQLSSRIIQNSNFSGNVGGSENKGNDFCDLSTDPNTAGLYSASSVSNIISTSSTIKFYYSAINLNLDCLLNNSCSGGDIYVNGSTGVNSAVCGLDASSPCATLEYGWANRVQNPGVLYVYDGQHSIVPRTFSTAISMQIIGTKNDSLYYPKVFPAQSSNFWFYLYDSSTMLLAFKKVNLLLVSGFNGHFFRTFYSNNQINIDSCVFSPNTTDTPYSYSIFYLDWGFDFLFFL